MSDQGADPEPKPPQPKTEPVSRPPMPSAMISDQLHIIFDEVAAEPIPQAFEDLLRQLR